MTVKLNQLLNTHQHSMRHQMNEFCLQQYFHGLCYCTLKANAENLQFLCLLYLGCFFLSFLWLDISKPQTKTFSPASSCTKFTITCEVIEGTFLTYDSLHCFAEGTNASCKGLHPPGLALLLS